jgi:hypothetical protein
VSFTPQPFGNDLFAQFGDEFALPVVGNFDPPVTNLHETTFPMHNELNPLDVNGDGSLSPMDALLVINAMQNPPEAGTYPDTNRDGVISPLDALGVINGLSDVTSLAKSPLSMRATAKQTPVANSESSTLYQQTQKRVVTTDIVFGEETADDRESIRLPVRQLADPSESYRVLAGDHESSEDLLELLAIDSLGAELQ